MSGEVCGDDRFELIAKAKAELLDATNIESSPTDMAALDSILFRCWQMGWLDRLRMGERETNNKTGDFVTHDNRTTELREKLNKLVIELDRLDITLDSPSSGMTLGEYEQEREKLLDGFTQAISATLGSERTCHEVMVDKFFRGCSECGYMWEYMYGIGKRERPNHCPNCGARVIE